MARSRSIASLAVTLTARTSTFRKRLFAAKALLKRFGSGVLGAAGTFAKLGTAAGLAGVAITTALVKRQFSAIDALAKLSAQTGISTKAIAGMRHAAELAGVDVTQFDKALGRMQRSIGEAAQGIGTAKISFDELGISTELLLSLEPEKRFETIAGAIDRVADKAIQAAHANAIFGRSGQLLLPMINAGAASLRQAAADADQFGLAIDNVAARQVEAANDSFTRLKGLLDGIARSLAVEIAPVAQAVADHFVDMGRSGRSMGETITDGMESAALAIGAVLTDIQLLPIQARIAANEFERLFLVEFPFTASVISQLTGYKGRGFATTPQEEAAKLEAQQERLFQEGTNIKIGTATDTRNYFDGLRASSRAIAAASVERDRMKNADDVVSALFGSLSGGFGFGGGLAGLPRILSSGKPAVVKDPELIVEVRRVTAAIERGNGAAIIGR